MQECSEACSGDRQSVSVDYPKPKGMSLLKLALMLRWVELGWGMVPLLGQTCPKEKVPLGSLRPALAVSLAVGGNTFIFNGYYSHISLSSLMSYLCGGEIKRAVKKPRKTSERTSPYKNKAVSY